MALRDMVTGSDACTTNDGAGPSNAFAGLANTILGTSSKDQERLKEVCPFRHLAEQFYVQSAVIDAAVSSQRHSEVQCIKVSLSRRSQDFMDCQEPRKQDSDLSALKKLPSLLPMVSPLPFFLSSYPNWNPSKLNKNKEPRQDQVRGLSGSISLACCLYRGALANSRAVQWAPGQAGRLACRAPFARPPRLACRVCW